MVADPVKDGLLDSHNGDLEPNLPLEVPKRTSTAEEVRLHASVHVLSTGCRGAYAPQYRLQRCVRTSGAIQSACRVTNPCRTQY